MKFPRYILELRELMARYGLDASNADVQARLKRLRESRRMEDNTDAFILGWLDERGGRV